MIHCLTNDPSLSPNEVFIEEEQHPRSHGRECKTRFSFNAEFDGCLTVQKGECLILCRHNNDGWSLGKSNFSFIYQLTGTIIQCKRAICREDSYQPTTWTCFEYLCTGFVLIQK